MSYRYRLLPTPDQELTLARHCADARFVWNLALEQTNLYRPEFGATPNYAIRNRQLAEARQETWLGSGSSMVQQQALRDFDRAMQNWWGGSHGRPTWRTKGENEGFQIVSIQWKKLNNNHASVWVPKIGWIKFRLSRPVPTESKSARITLDRSGRWHVSFTSMPEPRERTSTGAVVGIDRGIATTLATSDGQMFRIPTSPKLVEKTKYLQRQLVRQQQGSKRREKTRLNLAKTHARVTDRRKDWVEKMTTRLAADYDIIVLEDLKIQRMGQGPSTFLNRSIHEACWSLFQRRLNDKAQQSGVQIQLVNPAYTSQQCSQCGHTAKNNRESQAIFRCKKCAHESHADFNAAYNILARGFNLAPSPGRGEYARVSRPLVAAGTSRKTA
jgi:putative transposase